MFILLLVLACMYVPGIYFTGSILAYIHQVFTVSNGLNTPDVYHQYIGLDTPGVYFTASILAYIHQVFILLLAYWRTYTRCLFEARISVHHQMQILIPVQIYIYIYMTRVQIRISKKCMYYQWACVIRYTNILDNHLHIFFSNMPF